MFLPVAWVQANHGANTLLDIHGQPSSKVPIQASSAEVHLLKLRTENFAVHTQREVAPTA